VQRESNRSTEKVVFPVSAKRIDKGAQDISSLQILFKGAASLCRLAVNAVSKYEAFVRYPIPVKKNMADHHVYSYIVRAEAMFYNIS
jgi:hypothetical protein